MHGPPSGRRPVDDTINLQPPSEWLRSGKWLADVAGGAIAFPLTVLAHELAHFTAFAAFEFADPVLRYASTSWSGSGEFARLIRAGDVEAGGAGSTLAGGGRRGCGSDRHPSDGHRLRARGSPIRPRPAFPGSRSRAGDPAALAAGDWPHLPRARILVTRDRHSSRPQDARRHPDAGGQRRCGWPAVGPVAGAADSSVKAAGYGGHGTSQSSAIPGCEDSVVRHIGS